MFTNTRSNGSVVRLQLSSHTSKIIVHATVMTILCCLCRDRKRWILSVPVKGELWLDSGAVAAVRDQKKSLFAAGILKITGDFAAQDAVVLCDSSGYEFARGLCNYTQSEVHKVQVRRCAISANASMHVLHACMCLLLHLC